MWSQALKSYNVKYSVKRVCFFCKEKFYLMILDTKVQAESEDDARREFLRTHDVKEIKNIFEL